MSQNSGPERPRSKAAVVLLVTRLAFVVIAILLGGTLLASSLTGWRRPPDFLPSHLFAPSAWTAFDGGLACLALALVALALAAGWRIIAARRSRGAVAPLPTEPAGSLLGGAPRSPVSRYLIDVAICLGFSVAVLALPVLIVGGPALVFLGFFWTSLALISLIAGALLGALRG